MLKINILLHFISNFEAKIMNLLEDRHRLERLDQLIRLEVTGSPDELAEKMNVSRRTLFRTIESLKELGCPIYYNKHKNSYCYEYLGKLIIKFENNLLDNEELNKINGGCGSFFYRVPTHDTQPLYFCPAKQDEFVL